MDEVTFVKNRFRKEQWQKLIADYQNSGMKLYDWLTQNGISKDAYYYWLHKIRKDACKDLPIEVPEEKPVVFKIRQG